MPKTCPGHKEAIVVFDIEGLKVYAGAGMSKTPVPAGTAIFDLAGQMRPTIQTSGYDIPGTTRAYVRIDWDDRSTPRLTTDDWYAMASAILNHGMPIIIACMGGHGRTGTALAILGHYLGGYPSDETDPIQYVRDVYCPEAVETDKQVSYVKAMTSRTSACKGSDAVKPSYSGSKSYGTLCPDKINGKWCNLDAGHTGAHDTRSRSRIEIEQDALATPQPTSDPKKLTFCPVPVCMLKAGHKGMHKDMNDQSFTTDGN